jgi:hypothetical protein
MHDCLPSLLPFYGKPVAKFLTTSIQNANLARAETPPPFRVVEEQASQIQKVSTQLEATKPALQMVNNP